MLIPLTCYDTTMTLYIESSAVTTIVPLPESDHFPARTRVTVGKECVIVAETAEEVVDKLQGTT